MVGFLVFLSYSLIVSLGQADTQISREGKRIQYGDQPAYLKLVSKLSNTLDIPNKNELEAASPIIIDVQDDEAPASAVVVEEPTNIALDEIGQDIQNSKSLAIRELFGFDMINQTRWSSDQMKLSLQFMTQNKDGLAFMTDLIDTNPCVSNQEGYLALIEHGTRVVENARPEIEDIVLNIASFRDERNVTVILRKSADLLTQIENLFPKLEPITFLMQCKSTVEEGLDSIRELAQILFRMSKTDSNIFSEDIKETLLKSAHIIEVFTNFLDHFQENLSKRDCLTNKNFIGFGVDMVVKTLKDAAEAFGNLGYFPEAKMIRQHAAFTQASMKTVDQMDDLRFHDDCSYGFLTRASSHLNDLADIVDEVGLESLAMELGVVFRLDLLP